MRGIAKGCQQIVMGLSLMLVGMAAWANEPTEAEMRAAVQAQYDNVNNASVESAERCNNPEYNRGAGNPIQAMECIGLAVGGGGMTRDGRNVKPMKVTITTFEKIACEKAQGKAGYLCDYAMGYDTNNPSGMTGPYTRKPMASQARFVKQGNRWLRLEE